MKVLVTGSAGFIGFHTARRFLDAGHDVVGFDGFTDYYDPRLKRRRNEILSSYDLFTSIEGMLEDATLLAETIKLHHPEIVIHLAAQAGVRYSIESPGTYLSANIQGTFNLLEALRYNVPRHLLLASTSSVYGGNTTFPFVETVRTAFPVSLYAATKCAGEAISHSYAHLFGIPTTCFRFFTVYGPWGRPDMALFKFVDRILRDEEIEVYGNGAMSRDFTFIEDLVEGVVRLSAVIPESVDSRDQIADGDSLSPVAPWRAVNIAGGQPIPLLRFITAIEEALGKQAKKKMLPMQAGDVIDTMASPELLSVLTGYAPSTPIEQGVKAFVEWYASHQRDPALVRSPVLPTRELRGQLSAGRR